MDLYPTAEIFAGAPGSIAPADGNYAASVAPASWPAGLDNAAKDYDDRQQDASATSAPLGLGPNNERLEQLKPELVNALRELVRQYRQEGIVARRHEIRRIRQARLFWQGLQYAWWNPNDMNWHLPFEQRFNDDRELEEMPRYQFVTNFYQGFGLSFIAVVVSLVKVRPLQQREPLQPAGDAGEIAARGMAAGTGGVEIAAAGVGVAGLQVRHIHPAAPAGERCRLALAIVDEGDDGPEIVVVEIERRHPPVGPGRIGRAPRPHTRPHCSRCSSRTRRCR